MIAIARRAPHGDTLCLTARRARHGDEAIAIARPTRIED